MPLKGAMPQFILGTDFIPLYAAEHLIAEWTRGVACLRRTLPSLLPPPILESGAQGSRLADPIAGAAFGLLGLLAAQKP